MLLVFRVSSQAVRAMEGASDRGLQQGLRLIAGSRKMLMAQEATESSPSAVQACGKEQGRDLGWQQFLMKDMK